MKTYSISMYVELDKSYQVQIIYTIKDDNLIKKVSVYSLENGIIISTVWEFTDGWNSFDECWITIKKGICDDAVLTKNGIIGIEDLARATTQFELLVIKQVSPTYIT